MMEPTSEVTQFDAQWFRERLPVPDELENILAGDPVSALLNLARTRAPIETGFEGTPDDIDRNPEIAAQFTLATTAALKLKDHPNPGLTPGEIQALHAFVHLIARPALRVIEGTTPGAPEPWPELDQHRFMITHRIRSIGRLDTADGQPVGTGWFVSPTLLMTNNHVAAGLCGINPHKDLEWRANLDDAVPVFNKRWEKFPDERPAWDPGDSPSGADDSTGRLNRIIATHPILDMALLEVTNVTDAETLDLPLSADGPDEPGEERVYVVGYPAVFSHLYIHPELLKLLFGGTSAIVHKRVAPGLLRGRNNSTLKHDASTLGGNSGSAIIEFDSHRVVGLHYSGRYGTANYSVPLWHVKDDPFFKDNDIKFR